MSDIPENAPEEVIAEGIHYFVTVGHPDLPGYGTVSRVFKVYNKEFGVLIDETPSEMSARYYMQHHDKVKQQFLTEGLASLIGEAEAPHG